MANFQNFDQPGENQNERDRQKKKKTANDSRKYTVMIKKSFNK